jgi:CxxH/CxxC protein (TIGR04129 family)
MRTDHFAHWLACEEDVDAAIDEAVDRFASAPDIRPLEPREAAEAEGGCFWCGGTPRYLVEVPLHEEKGEGETT